MSEANMPPNITSILPETTPIDLVDIVPGVNFDFSGTWNDIDSDQVNLYYQLDKGAETLFASYSNPDKAINQPFSGTISLPQNLSDGAHMLKIIIVDAEGARGLIPTEIHMRSGLLPGEITEKYQNDAGVSIKPDNKLIIQRDEDYKGIVPEIANYTYLGYKIDNAPMQTGNPQIVDVTYAHTVIMIYGRIELPKTGDD